MADTESDYKVGPGRPPLHTRFKKRQSGNPGGRSTKSLPALLGRCAERDGRRGDRRAAPRDHQARGDRDANGRQIGECRSARDQDADRHDERRRAQGRRRGPAARTAPAGAAVRGAVAAADPAGDRRSESAVGLRPRDSANVGRKCGSAFRPSPRLGILPAIGTGERTSRPLGSAAFTDRLERRLGRRKPGPLASWCRHSDRATLCQSVRPAGDQLGKGTQT